MCLSQVFHVVANSPLWVLLNTIVSSFICSRLQEIRGKHLFFIDITKFFTTSISIFLVKWWILFPISWDESSSVNLVCIKSSSFYCLAHYTRHLFSSGFNLWAVYDETLLKPDSSGVTRGGRPSNARLPADFARAPGKNLFK